MKLERKVVVHIEDREEDILLVRNVLRKELDRIEVISLSDSENVMEEIKSGEFLKRRPYLLLIDINMPKISGIELLEALESKKEYRRIPRVIWSSSTHPDDLKKAYDNYANSFIAKPLDYSNLKETLLTTVNYWLNLNLK